MSPSIRDSILVGLRCANLQCHGPAVIMDFGVTLEAVCDGVLPSLREEVVAFDLRATWESVDMASEVRV